MGAGGGGGGGVEGGGGWGTLPNFGMDARCKCRNYPK